MSFVSGCAVAVIVSASVASVMQAQASIPRVDFADSSVDRIMLRVGRQPQADWFIALLREQHGAVGRIKNEAILDSLVARVVLGARSGPNDGPSSAARSALRALTVIGARGGDWPGRPNNEVFQRLRRVYLQVAQPELKSRCLLGMLATPQHSQAVRFLRDVAESSDPNAYDAVIYLVSDATEGSMLLVQPTPEEREIAAAAVRSLIERGKVNDRRSFQQLMLWQARSP